MASNTNLPPGPVSGRALARILGLASDNAVRVALRTGRLKRCKVPGGFDPAVAVEEWTATTDPRQQRKVTTLTDAAGAADAERAGKRRGKAEGKATGGVKRPEPAPVPPPPPTDAQARLAAHVAAMPVPGPDWRVLGRFGEWADTCAQTPRPSVDPQYNMRALPTADPVSPVS